MEKIILFLIQGSVEMTGIFAVSLALAKVTLLWGRIALSGFFTSVVILIIRSLPFTFGLHTIAALIIMAYLISKFTNVQLPKSFLMVFISFSLLAVLELIISKLIFLLTKTNPAEIMSNALLWKLMGMPQGILLIVIAVVISKIILPDSDAWKI